MVIDILTFLMSNIMVLLLNRHGTGYGVSWEKQYKNGRNI